MPTDISNAIGTARQFTPQPDAGYIGKYHGINISHAKASIDTSLGENMARLGSALLGYTVNHEKMLDATGYENAQRMLNQMSAEDIEKLSVIDAAQTHGFVDDTANPYFRAYADKLRGSFLSSRAKLDYDETYAMTPAKNMDEEAKRYADFVKEKKDLYKDTAENLYAFENGFMEGSLTHLNKLWSDHQQKRRQEDIIITMTMTNQQLGKITENTVALKAEGGMERVIEEAQTVWNAPRLMGLPPEHRRKLLEDWAMELIKTGHLGKDDFNTLMDGLTIQTRMDGTEEKASSLLNGQTYATMAAEYNRHFLTKELNDTINRYIEAEDADGWFSLVEEKRETDPDNALTYAQYTSHVLNAIRANQKSRAKAHERQLKADLKEQQRAAEAVERNRTANQAITNWMNGGDSVNGVYLKSLGLKPEDVREPMMNTLNHLIANEDIDGVICLMSIPLPGADDVKKTIRARMQTNFECVTTTSIENPRFREGVKDALLFCAHNANAMEGLFGEKVAREAMTLQLLTDTSGSFDDGLSFYAAWHSTPEETRRAFKAQAEGIIDQQQFKLRDMKGLEGGEKDCTVFDNPDLERDITQMAAALLVKGYGSPKAAVEAAAEKVKDNFYLFRGTAIPKSCLNIIPGENPHYLADALKEWAGDDVLFCRYNRQSQTFSFGEGAPELTLFHAQQNAIIIGEEKERELAEKRVNAAYTTLTAEELNQSNQEKMGLLSFDNAVETLID